ncbi:MAG: hypothetical protein EOM20_04795 [Spartobacteria bacterium]|nr:hypothetical protein [Spartobacteria bacterium]
MKDHAAQAGAPACTLPAAQLFRLSRGFLLLFWGIVLEFVFFFRIVDFHFAFRIPVPSYLFGVIIIYTGLIFLFLAGPLTPHWKKLVHNSLIIATLHVYFVPFVYWWVELQLNSYFIINIFGLLFCSLWLLILANRLAEEAAYVLHDQDLKYEAAAAGWGVILLLIIPVVIFLGLCAINVVNNKTALYFEVLILFQNLPKWLLFILVIPIALSIGSAWKAHAACQQSIRQKAKERDTAYPDSVESNHADT